MTITINHRLAKAIYRFFSLVRPVTPHHNQGVFHLVLKIFLLAVAAYGLVLGFMWYFQRHFIYQTHAKAIMLRQPDAPSPYRNLDVTTSDGIHLRGWYRPAAPAMPTIVYFHGNADNLPSTAAYHNLLTDQGFGLLLTSYRGYSGNKGQPTEENVYKDANAFIEGLFAQGVAPEDLIIYGYSLGTGIATEMATRYPPKALILGSPFSSLIAAAAAHYPYLPVAWLLEDKFDNAAKIGRIDAPILIINGRNDRVFPSREGDLVAAAAMPGRVTYKSFEGGHVDHFFDHGGDRFVAQWLDERFGRK